MTALDEVKSKIAATKINSSRGARLWLEQEDPTPVSNKPALVTAHQALRVWRVRLETSQAQHRGMQNLVRHLERMTPQSKVEQYAFKSHNKRQTALLFFKRRDSEFIGSIFVDQDAG